MWQALSNNPVLQLFVAIFILILFSFDRNLLVTQYLFGGRSNIWLITIFATFLVMYFLFLMTLLKGRLVIKKKDRGLMLITFLLALYFLLHELIFSDSLVSIKYSVFLFLISIALSIRYNFFFIFKVLGYLGGVIGFIVIFQQIALYILTSGNISSFDVAISGELWGRSPSCDFVAPLGIGLFERCAASPDFVVGDFIINRSIFFSTEPKYAASILLVTFSCLLISTTKSFARNIFIFSHLLSFVFILAGSAFVILFLSPIIVYLRFIGAKFYSALIFIAPVLILPTLVQFFISVAGEENFILFRLLGAATDIGDGSFNSYSIFGESFGSSCDGQACKDQGLLGSLTSTYGVIGLLLFWWFFYKLVCPMFESYKIQKINKSQKIGFMILLNTYVVFNIYFFSDIFNMFGLFIILTLILLPGYLVSKNEEKMPSQNETVLKGGV